MNDSLSKVRVFLTELSMLQTRLGEFRQTEPLSKATVEGACLDIGNAISRLRRMEQRLVDDQKTNQELAKYCATLDEFRPPL